MPSCPAAVDTCGSCTTTNGLVVTGSEIHAGGGLKVWFGVAGSIGLRSPPPTTSTPDTPQPRPTASPRASEASNPNPPPASGFSSSASPSSRLAADLVDAPDRRCPRSPTAVVSLGYLFYQAAGPCGLVLWGLPYQPACAPGFCVSASRHFLLPSTRRQVAVEIPPPPNLQTASCHPLSSPYRLRYSRLMNEPAAPAPRFLRDVHASRGSAHMFRGLDLDIATGETLALVGRSGAGKSTILKLINRLLLPHAGHVFVENRETREWQGILLRRRIGYVLQDIGLFPHMTVEENVGLVPRLEHGIPAHRTRGSHAPRSGWSAGRRVRRTAAARALGWPAPARRRRAGARRRSADAVDG